MIRLRTRVIAAVVAAALVIAAVFGIIAAVQYSAFAATFVRANGTELVFQGEPFEFAGANNYYLGHKSESTVVALLDDAEEAGLTVIRTWGFQDYGDTNGSGVAPDDFEDVWYQVWDDATGAPVVNTGATGLEKLDFVVAEAAARDIKLVIPFTNNWNAYGGMDQYVQWAGLDEHADFYTDERIRDWYKDWVSTLLNRTNTITGIQYKDDPTILAWELANEPSCTGSGTFADGECDTTTITEWVDEMSSHVKSIDRIHLLGVGDEGFFCGDEDTWTLTQEFGASGYGAGFGENCSNGVDTVALASLRNIDIMSMHLYPDHWQTSTAWGTGWIEKHAEAAAEIGKPVFLGEFGVMDASTRADTYASWLTTVRDTGVDGALFWMLASDQEDGTPYPDFDGFTVYCPSDACSVATDHAALIPGEE
ncbi:cellulase family glycosylhydrolase [Salinibacterium sp. NK8237]|uniref:glycoside hydrolase 5 family protein n=1 Tax=Salinibacterium sp. NK8237 TaxID=2792038 RepID=UPI0018CCCA01|nr:cellulase family glycosylhydrolase [Salinibacterium sp. NK8237]MBH0128819.1 cellulase family glycosylhydrolase [Salinibacterium sp. NK8237]